MVKTVGFGDVQIRCYPVILGDHPGTRKAELPLTFDWKHVDEFSQPIDMYEYMHDKRKNNKKLRLSNDKRRSYLMSIGYTHQDFVVVLVENTEIWESRRESAGNDADKLKNFFTTSGNLLSLAGSGSKSGKGKSNGLFGKMFRRSSVSNIDPSSQRKTGTHAA